MRKSLLMVGLISGLGIAGLTSCGILNKDKSTLTRNESLSMQAATSLSMVSGIEAPQKMNLMKAKDENSELSEAEKEEVKKILPTLDLMLTNSSSFDSVIENGNYTPVVEDGTLTFNTKEIISFLGTDGSKDSYTLYYNSEIADEVAPEGDKEPEVEAPIKAAKDVETEENSEDETEDSEENEEEKEEESTKVETEENIAGIAFIDETNYFDFESKVEKEVDKDETEEERTFKITTAKDSYIEVCQEHEVEGNEVETEFKYTIVENGKTTLEYSIEIETEDNQVELGYEIGGMEYELVKEEIDGETIYHVEVENESTDKESLISFKKQTNEETGEITYEEIVK